MKKTLATTATLLACVGSASASLWVDFNSNQSGGGTPGATPNATPGTAAKNDPLYQSYHSNSKASAIKSVALIKAAWIPGSLAPCPQSGTTVKSALGQALCNS